MNKAQAHAKVSELVNKILRLNQVLEGSENIHQAEVDLFSVYIKELEASVKHFLPEVTFIEDSPKQQKEEESEEIQDSKSFAEEIKAPVNPTQEDTFSPSIEIRFAEPELSEKTDLNDSELEVDFAEPEPDIPTTEPKDEPTEPNFPLAMEEEKPTVVEEEKVMRPIIETPVSISPPDSEEKDQKLVQEGKPVMEQYNKGVAPSLNDRFVANQTELSEKLNRGKIDDLRKAIPVGDRFLFIRELFENDTAAFDSAIRKLNQMEQLSEAELFLSEELSVKYRWSKNEIEAKRFTSIVKRRF